MFHFRWFDSWQNINIAVKELLPIVMATAIWGKEWSGQSVRCWCDNEAVVAVVNTGWCQDRHLMHLMRCLFFYAAHFRFCMLARHIAGAANSKADALSRGKLSLFFSTFPQACPTPSPIPQPLLELALDTSQDWTSPHWRETFCSSLRTV